MLHTISFRHEPNFDSSPEESNDRLQFYDDPYPCLDPYLGLYRVPVRAPRQNQEYPGCGHTRDADLDQNREFEAAGPCP